MPGEKKINNTVRRIFIAVFTALAIAFCLWLVNQAATSVVTYSQVVKLPQRVDKIEKRYNSFDSLCSAYNFEKNLQIQSVNEIKNDIEEIKKMQELILKTIIEKK